MMVIDEWMKAAMADEAIVADLLLRLRHSKPASLSPKSYSALAAPPSVIPRWGTKQPRSKPTAVSRCATASAVAVAAGADADAAVVSRKKCESDSNRCSPTTPLSWSGGAASPSATADGFEESSNPTASRSKATATSEYMGNSASTKKCKRKKTFAELMQEESSLLKERKYLKEEIANINATYKEQRAKNESLKRIKLDLGSVSRNTPNSSADEQLCTLSDHSQQRTVPSRTLTNATKDGSQPQAADSNAPRIELPDLNMMPSEDDSYTDFPCGMS